MIISIVKFELKFGKITIFLINGVKSRKIESGDKMINKNIMDVHIIDLDGNTYDINSIHVDGNDMISIIIKKPTEHYISKRKGRELMEKVIE